MIKCPECGHEISDQAPYCPSCGVAIKDKLTKCPACGQVYFKDQPACPKCGHPTNGQTENAGINTPATVTENTSATVTENTTTPTKRNNLLVAAVSVFAALLIGGICYFFYHQSSVERENQAYEYALSSTDVQVVQNYLDTYMDEASEEHIQNMEKHLSELKQSDEEWTNALVSGSKSALEQYLEQHPDSPFKSLAIHKIDSIDWAAAQAANTVEAMETYLEQHADGEHVDEANQNIKGINAKTVQPEDKLMVRSIFDSFFSSINNKDEDAVTSAFGSLINSFLGKTNATRNDVVTFLHKIYKTDIASMDWSTVGDYTINKKEVGDGQYEYSVSFTAGQNVSHTDGTNVQNKYRISAKINPDGKITDLNMVKLLE